MFEIGIPKSSSRKLSKADIYKNVTNVNKLHVVADHFVPQKKIFVIRKVFIVSDAQNRGFLKTDCHVIHRVSQNQSSKRLLWIGTPLSYPFGVAEPIKLLYVTP